MAKTKLEKKTWNKNLNVKVISVSNENYLS